MELKCPLLKKKQLLRKVAIMGASITPQCTYGMEIMCPYTFNALNSIRDPR